jgi:thiol-disulfide isomerase/thioredoxin
MKCPHVRETVKTVLPLSGRRRGTHLKLGVNKKKSILLGLVLTGILINSQLQGAANLAIGDPAPPFSVKEWIKGGPLDISAGKGKNIYVIEFWATWCGPCRETIPHVTELQKKYRDRGVVFMGLTDEAPSLVKTFVQKMGAKMDYAVGIDERDKAFGTYMTPFDQQGIPHAFIIDKEGHLVWHGHPMAGLDKALEELTSGKFNLELARKQDQITKMQLEYIELVNAPATREKAAELGNSIVAELGKNAGGLNAFAWRILTDRRIKHRDSALALKAVKLAYESGGAKDASIVDTYARALFESGQKEAAIEQQKAAIALAKEEGQRIEYEGTLKKYQRLLRESAN